MSPSNSPQHPIAPTVAISSRPARGLHLLWKRKNLLALGLVISTFLGGVYYSTAARDYSSSAELTILSESSPHGNGATVSETLTTYQNMLTSTPVLQRAVESMPREVWLSERETPSLDRLESVRSRFSVSPLPGTSALRVSYRSSQPKIAAFTLARILESFQKHLEAEQDFPPAPELDALTNEKANLVQQLTNCEAELAALEQQAETEFGDLEETKRRLLDLVARLNYALSEAQRERLAAEAFLAVIEANVAIRREARENEPPPVPQETFATAQLRQSLMQYRTDLRELQLQYGAAHPRIRELHEKIRHTEQWLQNREAIQTVSHQQFHAPELIPPSLSTARHKALLAQTRETSLRGELESERASALKLNDLLARLEILRFDRKRLNAKQEQLQEQISQAAQEPMGKRLATITVPPRVPSQPVTPKLGPVIAVSQLMGVLLGLGFIHFAEKRSNGFRMLTGLSRRLKLPVLASIGELSATGGKGFDAIQSWAFPDSAETEPFQTLLAVLDQLPIERRQFAITSAEAGAGKTTVAANLAVTSAQAGQKTLLIDGDLDQSGLSALLGVQGPRGFSSLLADHRPIAESAKENIVPMLQPGLDLLPAGPMSRLSFPDPWTSRRVQKLFAWAESNYDRMIVDCPPLTDPATATLGEHIAGTLLIVDLQTDRSRVSFDGKALEKVQTLNLLGMVANRVF